MTHYVLFDSNVTKSAVFDEIHMGTDLNEAKVKANHYVAHLTKKEIEDRDELKLVACHNIPDDADINDTLFDDFVSDTIIDYKVVNPNDTKKLIIDCKYWAENNGYTHTETIQNEYIKDSSVSQIIANARSFCDDWIGKNAAEFTFRIYAGDADPMLDDPEVSETYYVNMD